VALGPVEWDISHCAGFSSLSASGFIYVIAVNIRLSNRQSASKTWPSSSLSSTVVPSDRCHRTLTTLPKCTFWYQTNFFHHTYDTIIVQKQRGTHKTHWMVAFGLERRVVNRVLALTIYTKSIKAKAVPLHATKALGGRGDIAPTHFRPRHLMGMSGQRHATAAL
jgi:hypothetical protein